MQKASNQYSEEKLYPLYLITLRVIGLFTYYSFLKGYPFKITGKPSDRLLENLMPLSDTIVRIIAIKDVIKTLREIPIEIIFETRYHRVIDSEIRGQLDLPRTMQLLLSGRPLAVSIVSKHELDSPEMILLYNIVNEINDVILEVYRLRSLGRTIPVGAAILEKLWITLLEELRGSIRGLEWLTWLIPRSSAYRDIDELINVCREVLDRGYFSYYRLASSFYTYFLIRKTLTGFAWKKREQSSELAERILLEPDKVFELYVYFLTAYSLLQKLSSTDTIGIRGIEIRSDHIAFTIIKETKTIEYRVYHDKSFSEKSWLTKTAQNTQLKPSRPDITITRRNKQEEIILIADAKNRLELGSVFRDLRIVMGYMYEYNTNNGALIFNETYTRQNVDKPLQWINTNKYLVIIPVKFSMNNKVSVDIIDKIINQHSKAVKDYIIDAVLNL